MISRVALGLAVYGTSSMMLFSIIAEKALTNNFFTSIPLAILTGILLFLNVLISEQFDRKFVARHDDHTWCPYFWILSFVVGGVMGFFVCYVVQDLGWNFCVTIVLWAGLYGFSHSISHEVRRYKNLLDNAKAPDFKNKEIYSDWLKLEHDFFQASFRTYFSLLTLIVIGGIVGYFLYVGNFWSPGMIDTVILTGWGIVG
ncbi:MAG: hypothetical protein FK732_06815, partial [Asgard group archaeon]|nr:hypothetical protein [Asgard group archaeon]